MSHSLSTTALYTSEQSRLIDAQATAHLGIPGFILMERAAAAAFACLQRRWPDARRLTIYAGAGNNGGDAFLIGALALRAGFAVDAIALSGAPGVDAAKARAQFQHAGGTLRPPVASGTTSLADVHVDGLFGTGLKRPASGDAAAMIDALNATGQPVLALDVPSGLDSDSGMSLGRAVRADATISFIAWKRGLFTADGADCCGARELATLRLPEECFEGIPADAWLMDAGLGGLLAPRTGNVNKSSFGHLLAIGGDAGTAGAIHLTGEAALRCGAGLVSVATRAANVGPINAARPELMARAVGEVSDLAPLIGRASVLAVGPGLGQGDWGRALFQAAVASGKPLVIDADALNLLASQARALPDVCVLTPHPGEAARLLGCDVIAVQRDRFAAVREIAARYSAVCVLKGAGSLVANAKGEVAVCPWGNAGMASGGMGDVLTGVIAALLAQGLPAWDAARLGVALHACAGDAAAQSMPRGLIASDLFLPLRRLANHFEP